MQEKVDPEIIFHRKRTQLRAPVRLPAGEVIVHGAKHPVETHAGADAGNDPSSKMMAKLRIIIPLSVVSFNQLSLDGTK